MSETMDKARRIEEVLKWFGEKGITPDTVKHFGISIGDDRSVGFPYGQGYTKLRYGVPSGERHFVWKRGVPPMLFNRTDLGAKTLFLCEGETDTMRLWQELGREGGAGVVGIPGIHTWNEGMVEDLASADHVYVILDNDPDYNVARQVDETYRAIHRALGRKARRIVLPRGIKDLCEFFGSYNLDSFRMLVERSPKPGESRFRTLDLTQEPPEPAWAIQDFICRGDIHLLMGEPSIGKSWITMGMAIAVASGWDSFLGLSVPKADRVLYFDEENPEDVIFHRFLRLGLTHKTAENIRFINNIGLRLDQHPGDLLDEALDFEPALIILDSLTRFHGVDENSAGDMAELFNSGIKPLARETGAGLVVIHHITKTDSTSSFKRARGSGDITASVDTGFDVVEMNGALAIKNFKSRRSVQNVTRYVSIVDKHDGSVELVGTSEYRDVF